MIYLVISDCEPNVIGPVHVGHCRVELLLISSRYVGKCRVPHLHELRSHAVFMVSDTAIIACAMPVLRSSDVEAATDVNFALKSIIFTYNWQ